MKNLLILTDHLPYGKGEPFLYPEIEFLVRKFNITVVTTDTRSELSSNFKWDFPVHRIQKIPTFCETLHSTFKFFFTKDCLKEFGMILHEKKNMYCRGLCRVSSTLQKHRKQRNRLKNLESSQNKTLFIAIGIITKY